MALVLNGNGTINGNLVGNVTGDVTGNVTGNVTGDVTGNADTATNATTVTNGVYTTDTDTVTQAMTNFGVVKQMKHVTLNSQFTTTANGDVTALSLNFDNPVTVGNQILVMSSGAIVAGVNSDNWGAGADIWLDSSRLSSDFNTNTSPGGGVYMGTTDNNGHTSGWGMNFSLVGIGTAGSTNPTVALKVNRLVSNGGWTWVGVGYTAQYYGKTSTNLIAMEFGD